ncbi:hypothetical protein [Microbacterium sp. SS28]|uniref:DUF7657 domain-containing protein n=1 Tax=Microbacterium sp. SS28 TaxID=2919948 RepID=UPI001FA9D685|nr:hypothetical protein [Microbacterium sp. SS28]
MPAITPSQHQDVTLSASSAEGTIAASAGPTATANPQPNGRDASRLRRRLPIVVPVIAYLILVLLGVTTSNIGIGSLREDPADPEGLQFGYNQPIRSDEYGTGSPLWLGEIARGGAEPITPLSAPEGLLAQLPEGVISGIVFFDGSALALGEFIPAQMLFAMKWWLPTLLLFLGLPLWFRQITGRLRWGYLAAVLIAVAPGNAWWSGLAINTIGFVAAGCALTIYSASWLSQRRHARAVVGFVLAGILFARTPTYYQPFAIMLSIPFVVATALFIVLQTYRLRDRIISVIAITTSSLVWTAALFWESRDALAAGLTTVYPGTRLSSGEPIGPGFALGATNLGGIVDASTVSITNQSEISTSFTLLLPVTLVLCALGGRWWVAGGKAFTAVFVTMAAAAVFWTAWISFEWGAWSAAIPLVNRVPAHRAALGVGFLATIAFCLLMSHFAPRWGAKWIVPSTAAVVAGGLSFAGGFLLRSEGYLPGLRLASMLLASVVCAAAIFALVRWPGRVWSMIGAGLAALTLTAAVSPVIFGVGDFRDSATAQKFLDWAKASRADGALWASDSGSVDSLLMASGAPSLSGRQIIGPVVSEWSKLDPGRANENVWNRGGAHIAFEWADEGLRFEQPYPDVIKIIASPCEVQSRLTDLQYVVSSRELEASCLTEIDAVQWSGQQHFVYEVTPSE